MADKMAIIPIEAVTEGTKLIADGGFTCLKEGEAVTVAKDEEGDLYVPCSGGEDGEYGKPGTNDRSERHLLDGQLDAAGKNYVGFFLGGDAP